MIVKNVFIAKPSDDQLQALEQAGFHWCEFVDRGRSGILITERVSKRQFSEALASASPLRVTLDDPGSEFEGIVAVRLRESRKRSTGEQALEEAPKNAFIANPSPEQRQALLQLGLAWYDFQDRGRTGVLLAAPANSRELLAKISTHPRFTAFLDPMGSEFEGIVAVSLREKSAQELQELPAPPVLERAQGTNQPPAVDEDQSTLENEIASLCRSIRKASEHTMHMSAAETEHELRHRYSDTLRRLELNIRKGGVTGSSQAEHTFSQELDLIVNHPQVTRVTFIDDALRVTTRKLCCVHPETHKVHSIGRFEITIQITGTESDELVEFKNLTRSVEIDGDLFAAPHIMIVDEETGQTHACLGNLDGALYDLVLKGEYFTAVDMAIKFVESVNIDDVWGEGLDYWPIKSKGSEKSDDD